MFWHVWHRVSLCKRITSVTLATDDDKIFSTAKELGVPVVMTSSQHQSGTDRVYEAATSLGLADNAIVINVQGDEPTIDPKCLDDLINLFSYSEVQAGTLARRITSEMAQSSDVVKVVINTKKKALYFSRSPIPFDRDTSAVSSQVFGHMGIYAFTISTLRKFISLPLSILEQTEKREQLRLLDNDIPIYVGITEFASPGVDRKEDIEKILPLLS